MSEVKAAAFCPECRDVDLIHGINYYCGCGWAGRSPLTGPALSEGMQSESGDCDVFCSLCHETRDEPHTWEECARRLGPIAEAGYGADCERQQLADVLALVLHVAEIGADGCGSVIVDAIRYHAPVSSLPALSCERVERMLEMQRES